MDNKESWDPVTWVTEEQFLNLFRYTGPEVIPGEFLRALNAVVNQQKEVGREAMKDHVLKNLDWYGKTNLGL